MPELIQVSLNCLREVAMTASEAETQRARAQMKVGMLSALETPGGRVEHLARQVLTVGRIAPRGEIAGRIDAVSVEDVKRAAMEVLASKPAFAMVGPKVPELEGGLARLVRSGAH